jgi:ubiquinol-cytochrome c reductase cytochrome c1 subunit
MRLILSVAAMAMVLGTALPASAQQGEAEIQRQNWSFGGAFGTFDKNQLQRGFQVFKEICSNCHGAHLLAFRNLSEKGGPEFSEAQVKALAATYTIADPDAEGGSRPGVAADHWPDPFPTDQDARDANGGAIPPDMSVLAKARSIETPFPNWLLNYVLPYQEGGPDYIHALMLGYSDEVPEGVTIPEGKFYNAVYPGHAIGMPPPLSDGAVTYGEGEEGETPVPQTADQYARDVSAFLMWVAEPHMVDRKEAGFRVILFLILFAGLMWVVKRRVWSRVEH